MLFIKKKIAVLVLAIYFCNLNFLYSDERIEAIVDQMQIVSKDLKILEKAFYKSSDIVSCSSGRFFKE